MPCRVVHLTSVHRAFDTRIFHKECRSLAMAGYDVTLVAPHAEGDGVQDGVKLRAIRPPRNRRERILRTVGDLFKTALKLDADIYHFHDPELMPIGGMLKVLGKRVIYDVHEDYSGAMEGKKWIPRSLRAAAASAVTGGEIAFSSVYDRVIAATPRIALKFPRRKTRVVQNFPWTNELYRSNAPKYPEREPIAAYVGAISNFRGLREMSQAVALTAKELPVRLVTAGKVFAGAEAESAEQTTGGLVEHLGLLNRNQVADLLARARVGLMLLHPLQNYVAAQPTKLFEYMSAGIPVIASDFPLSRQLVESCGCGLLVDPLDPVAIATALVWLLQHPSEAEQMGRNGQRAVTERFNWESESERLIGAYTELQSTTR
jgi:glycosyltransferase involved in cell wall biosynthesis